MVHLQARRNLGWTVTFPEGDVELADREKLGERLLNPAYLKVILRHCLQGVSESATHAVLLKPEQSNPKSDFCFSYAGENQLVVRVRERIGHLPGGIILRLSVAQIPYNRLGL